MFRHKLWEPISIFASVPALTRSGYIGVKVWIYKGEVFSKEEDKKGEVVGNKKLVEGT